MGKTKEELEDEIWDLNSSRKVWRLLAILFAIFLVVVVIIDIIDYNKYLDAKEELSLCQEQVEVWTLKVECDMEEFGIHLVADINYSTYEEYIEAKENYFWDECEVIE